MRKYGIQMLSVMEAHEKHERYECIGISYGQRIDCDSSITFEAISILDCEIRQKLS